jgi:hypothetical protein
MKFVIYKINRPSLLRWAIGFLFCSYFSTSKASPNDSGIVTVVIIIVDEAVRVLHSDGIIAQRTYFVSAFSGAKITILCQQPVRSRHTYQFKDRKDQYSA